MRKLIIYYKFIFIFFICKILISAQTHFPADPFFILQYEKNQFNGKFPIEPNIFRPYYLKTDSINYSLILRNESYFNNNAPNQENMDVRYFSKGYGTFNSLQFVLNSPYFSLMVEPYIKSNNFKKVNSWSCRRHINS